VARYADDLLLFGDDKGQLWDWRDALAERLGTIRMRLHADKTQLRATNSDLKFLGFVLSRDGRRLQHTTLVRFNLRLRRLRWLWKHGRTSPKDIRRSLTASAAHASFGNSRGVMREQWRRIRFSRVTQSENVVDSRMPDCKIERDDATSASPAEEVAHPKTPQPAEATPPQATKP
jgi:hypothetical protein